MRGDARTSTLRDLGGYDSRFPHTADTYLWRQLRSSATCGYVSESLYQYRIHADAMSAKADRALTLEQEHLQQLDLLFEDPLIPEECRVRASHYYAELYWSIADSYAKSGRRLLALRRLARAIRYEPTIWTRHRLYQRPLRRLRRSSSLTANTIGDDAA